MSFHQIRRAARNLAISSKKSARELKKKDRRGSVTRRIDGAGGKRTSFWATNSLRMSFWVVPSSSARGTPAFSAATMYIAQIGAAGAVIVIDGDPPPGGRPGAGAP